MKAINVDRDERTLAVENASYRWSTLVLSFGLLGLTAWRSLVRDEQPWDLLALVVAGGLVNTIYQLSHRVLNRRWGVMVAATFGLAGIVALVLFALTRRA
jgi:hypothetical protein